MSEQPPDVDLPVDYWHVTWALGCMLNEIVQEDGPLEANHRFWQLSRWLSECCPGYDWQNSISDTYTGPK